jgi:hypothetical protein
VAAEVNRLLKGPLVPVDAPPVCRFARIDLPFDIVPDREQWARRAGRDDAVGYHARRQLARIDRGEPLPKSLSYPVQVWRFGDQLAMVFLAGEVVVDYVLRLKQLLAIERLSVTAYANDVPCYIPSRRILAEGGYEAEESMLYYDWPARLSPEVEDMIVNAVRSMFDDAQRGNRP